MQKRIYTYLLILTLLLASGGLVRAAVTDPIQNGIDTAGLYVDALGNAQENINSYVSGYIQGKVGKLGDSKALAKAAKKAEKAKKKYEKAQKEAAKVQKMGKDAAAKAKKLQDKADKLKEKADKAQAKLEKAKAKAQGYVDDAKGAYNDVKGYADQAKGYMNDARNYYNQAQGYINDVKSMAGDIMDVAQSGAALASSKANSALGRTAFDSGDNSITIRPGASTSDAPMAYIQPETEIPEREEEIIVFDNRAQTIENFAAESAVSEVPVPLNALDGVEEALETVSAEDILARAKKKSEQDAARLQELKTENPQLSEEELQEKLKSEKVAAAAENEQKSGLSMLEQLQEKSSKAIDNSEGLNALTEKLAEQDKARLEELKAQNPQMTQEELLDKLKSMDEAKKAGLTNEFLYSRDELNKNLEAKDEAKRATFKNRNSRRAFETPVKGGRNE